MNMMRGGKLRKLVYFLISFLYAFAIYIQNTLIHCFIYRFTDSYIDALHKRLLASIRTFSENKTTEKDE